MKTGIRPVALLALLSVLEWAAAVRSAAPPPAPDVREFRTVETAITTRVSAAAPSTPRQPAYLGVHAEPKDGHLVVLQVEAGSPAERAGIQVGDIVRAAAGQPVIDGSGLGDLVRARAPGEELRLALLRVGKPMDVTVALKAVSRPLVAGSRVVLGVQVEPAVDGVKVTAVTPGLPAATAGVKPNDIIRKVDDTPVAGDRLSDALASHRPGDEVTLLIDREGKEREVKTRLVADPNATGRGPRSWDDRRTSLFRKPVYRLAVVCVEYPDAKHNPMITASDWEQSLFSTGTWNKTSPTGQTVYGSMNDYYREQSCGTFRVEGKVFDWIQVKEKRADYGSNSNRTALLTEALDKLVARDGSDALKGFDGIFFLYAGDRFRTTRGGLYWPHKANVNWKGQRWSYFICPEGGKTMASISVITHEFGHMLGLPDLYARPENPGSEGLGIWCTMSTGHGQKGRPLHFSAWCKEQLGWLKPAVVDPRTRQKLILAPVEGSARECFKVLIKPDGSEYLLLENRIRREFDQDLPAEGLLIWRVVDGKPVLEESHGITTPDGPMRFLGSIPYPSPSNNAFTPFTTPSSTSRKGSGLPVHITNIRRLPDGRITFFLGFEYL
jgi:M6 family metalloprotease-like protein